MHTVLTVAVHRATVAVHRATVDAHLATVDAHLATVDAHRANSSCAPCYSRCAHKVSRRVICAHILNIFSQPVFIDITMKGVHNGKHNKNTILSIFNS